jgi:hypothetical protein
MLSGRWQESLKSGIPTASKTDSVETVPSPARFDGVFLTDVGFFIG